MHLYYLEWAFPVRQLPSRVELHQFHTILRTNKWPILCESMSKWNGHNYYEVRTYRDGEWIKHTRHLIIFNFSIESSHSRLIVVTIVIGVERNHWCQIRRSSITGLEARCCIIKIVKDFSKVSFPFPLFSFSLFCHFSFHFVYEFVFVCCSFIMLTKQVDAMCTK